MTKKQLEAEVRELKDLIIDKDKQISLYANVISGKGLEFTWDAIKNGIKMTLKSDKNEKKQLS